MATGNAQMRRGPLAISKAAWVAILKRVWASTGHHDIGFLAAGVAFFAFLSIAPGLGLIVMLYGLFAAPPTIFDNLTDLLRLMPAEAAKVIVEQLASLIKTAAATEGKALIPAVVLALYGASGAARGIVSSLNVIYDQREQRGLVQLTLVAAAIAAAGIVVACLGLAIASATAFLAQLAPGLGGFGTAMARLVVWLAGAALATMVIALIYRFGPCRRQPHWRWLSLGSLVATALWLLVSVGFGWYVSLARFDSTYGSLATVAALLMWLYVSAYALLLGASLEAEGEKAT